jgi:hypothetical protein
MPVSIKDIAGHATNPQRPGSQRPACDTSFNASFHDFIASKNSNAIAASMERLSAPGVPAAAEDSVLHMSNIHVVGYRPAGRLGGCDRTAGGRVYPVGVVL